MNKQPFWRKNRLRQTISQRTTKTISLLGASAVILGASLAQANASTTVVGAGSIANQANPKGYGCTIDHGNNNKNLIIH